MGKMNLGRIVIGGLAAGLVINLFEFVSNTMVFASQMADVMRRLNLSADFTANQIVTFNVMGFTTGIFLVWLYAAIRPRYGAGPKTAVTAAMAVWVIGYLLPNWGMVVIGVFPAGLISMGLLVGMVELILGGLAGAALYKDPAGAPQTAAAHA